MKIKISKVIYWLSVVRPIADICIGVWQGVINAVQASRDTERLEKEREQFMIDHSIPFLSIKEGEKKDDKSIQ